MRSSLVYLVVAFLDGRKRSTTTKIRERAGSGAKRCETRTSNTGGNRDAADTRRGKEAKGGREHERRGVETMPCDAAGVLRR